MLRFKISTQKGEKMENDSKGMNVDFVMDGSNLYREESFTDMKVGAVRQLSPVTADGAPDGSRKPIYYGHTQLMSPEGPLPVSCSIAAGSLPEAVAKFPDAMRREIQRIMDELRNAQQNRRDKEQSRIVTL
jgi:hypothetical protein